MPSLKKNFFYSALLTVANYVFPLITYPYVSRVLGVTNIGMCNFVDNIINYFLVFSTMGISVLGVREIAAARDDREERNRVFSSLLFLNVLTTLIATAVLLVSIFVVPSLVPYRKLLLVGVAKLLANSLFLDWLYRGVEEFGYITYRSVLIKILYVVSIFLFVRKAEDYGVYFLLLTLSAVLNALVNILYSGKYVRVTFRGLSPGPFVMPYLVLGLNYVLTSMYTSFNVIFLGMVHDPEQVGYYTSATKILSIVTAFFTACTTVLLPRMSAVLSEGKEDVFRSFVEKTFNILFLAGVPLVILIEMTAGDIIRVLSGAGYEGSNVPLMIVTPLILIVGLEEILIVQVMMPRKMDRRILRNSVYGAIVGLSLNLLLVRLLKAEGSAIVWLCSETAVLLSAAFAVFGYSLKGFPGKRLLKDIVLYLPLLVLLWAIRLIPIPTALLRCIVNGMVAGSYFLFVSCRVVKDPVVMGLLQSLLSWKKR